MKKGLIVSNDKKVIVKGGVKEVILNEKEVYLHKDEKILCTCPDCSASLNFDTETKNLIFIKHRS